MTHLDATDGIECLTAGTDTNWEVVNNFLKCKYKFWYFANNNLGKYSFLTLGSLQVKSQKDVDTLF